MMKREYINRRRGGGRRRKYEYDIGFIKLLRIEQPKEQTSVEWTGGRKETKRRRGKG